MSYYKQIDGIQYDRALLEAAQEAVSGRGDGRVSRADAEALLSLVTDGGRYTAAEEATIAWARANLTWTDKARAWFDQALQEWQDSDPAPPEEPSIPVEPAEATPTGATPAPPARAPGSAGPALIFRIAPGNRFARFFGELSSQRAAGRAVVLLPTNDGDVPLEPIWARTEPHRVEDLPGDLETALCSAVLDFARLHITSLYRLLGSDRSGLIRYKVGFTNVPLRVLIRALHAEGFRLLDAESRL